MYPGILLVVTMSKAIDSPESESSDTAAIEDGRKLPKSVIFEILSADRRQEVLRYLDETGETANLGELAEHIASLECDCEISQLSSQQRKRTYVGLYQCHLPKMADAGVIDYNSDRGTVALNGRSGRLLEYLYLEESEETEQADGIFRGFFG
jgi:DNA-binding transcriptional ArsR family regulator